ncbi:MAG: hypothetical protein AAF674_12945 [Pseudomonadota bacterium]
MADLLSFEKTGDVYSRAHTLDALWAEAEALGKVSIETSWSGSYTSTINCTVRRSNVFAKGEGDTPVAALEDAIREARAIGAE